MRLCKRVVPAVALAVAVTTASAQPMIGYRGDTTGVFEGAHAPTKGKVLWKTPMPNWCYGFPIVVGNKVLCMSEPGWKEMFPTLLCLNTADGKELWRLELDHLPYTGLDKSEQDKLRAEFATRWKWWQDTWTASGGKTLHTTRTDPPWSKTKKDPLDEHGLYAGTWYDWGMSLIGSCFPTPVSDGKSVYVVTGRGTTACISLDGKIQWLVREPLKTYSGEDCRNARSPLLWGNLLIAAGGNSVRAYDKATGRKTWEIPQGAGHTVATPVFITLGDTECIYTCVNTFIRLKDGKKLDLKGGIGEGVHTPTVNDEDDIIYFAGNGEHCSFPDKGKALGMPIAVKFSLSGETVTGTVVWQAPKDKANNEPPLYFKGRLYCGKGIYDAKTGALLAGDGGKSRTSAVPATRHVLLTDGQHVFGVDAKSGRGGNGPGIVEAYTFDGKPAGRTELPYSTDPARCKAKMGGDDWGFSGSCPFTLADGRIHVRGYDSLYCVGP